MEKELPAAIEYELSTPTAKRTAYIVGGSLFFMVASLVFQIAWHRNSEFWTEMAGVIPVLGIVGVICLGALKAMHLERLYKVELSPDGIKFSNQWRYELLGRLQRDWADLHSVTLLFMGGDSEVIFKDRRPRFKWYEYDPHEVKQLARLIFDFKSGGSAYISLKYLTHDQAATIFRGLETFANPACFTGDVLRLEKSILLEQKASFTEMWQDDLNARYIATNYVPLPTNHCLQDGQYKVLLQLAAGGMSAVYLAAMPSGEKIVLKEAAPVVGDEPEQSEKAKELFAREAKMLLQLEHPNLARVRDNFSENGRDYLVLDYVPGQTLRQYVQRSGAATEEQALKWAAQLAKILEYLHAHQPPILHRDVSPDNVILREDGQIILVDFGAANEYLGNATGTFIGKQCYMAPEQVRGRAVPQSDIYSLGATVHFLLTGSDPIPLTVSRPKDKAKHPVSNRCDELVAACTEFEIASRLSTAREFSEKVG